MKKIFAILLCLAFTLCVGMVAHATGLEPDITIESSGGVEGTEDNPTLQPIEVKMEMVGEVPYITRVYAVDPDGDSTAFMAGLAVDTTFEQDGYLFTRHETSAHVADDKTESRTETLSRTMEVPEYSIRAVLEMAERDIPYSQDGFAGMLALDESTIQLTESSSEPTSYRVSDTREYSNLDRQDAAYIPKTITQNGVTLKLENVEWTVIGTTPTGDGPVANLFRAVGTYSGVVTTSTVSSYTATFRYTGTVSRAEPGNTHVSIVYRGEVVAPAEQKGSFPLLPTLAICLVCLAVLAAGVAAFLTRGKWMRHNTRQTHDTRRLNVAAIRQAAEAGYDDMACRTDVPSADLDCIEQQEEDVYGETGMEENGYTGYVDDDGYDYGEDDDE